MKLTGNWRIVIEGGETPLQLFPWQRTGFDYLIGRLFQGEEVADSAFEHYDVTVRFLEEGDEIISVPPLEDHEALRLDHACSVRSIDTDPE